MAAQYCKGSYVRYASSGICLIEDIRREAHAGTREEKEFLILKPVASKGGTVYVPADNPALLEKMQPISTAGEIESLLSSVRAAPMEWIDDRKNRASAFQAILKRSDLRELLEMVSSLCRRRQDLAALGKKLSASDEAVLRRAEGLIQNELAFVLGISEKQVGPYLRDKLGILE